MSRTLLSLTFIVSFISVTAQDDAAELAKKLANPIASLISVPLQNNLDHGIGELRGSRYTLNIQPVIPVRIGANLNLITRVILPVISQYNITGPAEHQGGLADAVVSGFLSPTNSPEGLTWGAGPVFLVPTGTNDYLSTKKFGVGPTAVALKQSNGWTYGMLVNQIWSVAGSSSRQDLSQAFFNPFVTYNWKSGAGVTANMEWTHDWVNGNTNMFFTPIMSALTSFGKQKVSFAIGPRFNLAAPESVRSRFGIRAAVVFLFPK